MGLQDDAVGCLRNLLEAMMDWAQKYNVPVDYMASASAVWSLNEGGDDLPSMAQGILDFLHGIRCPVLGIFGE